MKVPFACFIFLLAVSPAIGEIKIYSPQDMKISFSEIEVVSGTTNDPFEFTVNNIPVAPRSDGSFMCGAVLNPGKNLVEVKNEKEKKKIRILKMITFPDVDDSENGKKHSARSYVLVLATLGIIEGMPDGNFNPDYTVTRGDFVSWLVKAKRLPPQPLASDVYLDVPKEHWRAALIEAAKQAGYIGEYKGNLLGIDEAITRNEADESLRRAEGASVEVTQSSSEAVDMTRAQAAILIARLPSVQRQIKFLSDFNRSYTIGKFCAINVSPEVERLTIDPKSAAIGEQTVIKLRASLASRLEYAPIAKVKADLSVIGGAYDAEMVDDGTNGDEAAGDGIYSLNFTYMPKEQGNREIIVKATDQRGWEGVGRVQLSVL